MLAIHIYVTMLPSVSVPRSVDCHRLCVLLVWSVHRLFIRSLTNLNELSVISVPFLTMSFPKLFKLCLKSFDFNKLFHTHILLVRIIKHTIVQTLYYLIRGQCLLSQSSHLSCNLRESKYIWSLLSVRPPYSVLPRHLICYDLYFVSFRERVLLLAFLVFS